MSYYNHKNNNKTKQNEKKKNENTLYNTVTLKQMTQ